ncbi:NADH dehydrogenase (ubiquinone) 1 alpha subcomplex subunit 9 [Azospirillaceae bacterium]
MSNRKETVTVFGGSGFIGRHLVRRLAKTGVQIRIASRRPSQAAFLKTCGNVGQIVPIAVDITCEDSVAAAVRGSDVVINLSGILVESRKWSFETVHADAPARIARHATKIGARRFIHMSSLGANSASSSTYARSKAAGDVNVLAAYPGVTIMRPGLVYGPEDTFFNQYAKVAQIAPALPLFGGGKTRFQPIYVGDVAEAVMAALADPNTQGRTYELGGPRVYTFKELIVLLMKEIHASRPLISLPWIVGAIIGGVMEKLPNAFLSRDLVELLKSDVVVNDSALTMKDLGVEAAALETILPTYVDRFRPGGRFCRDQVA